MQQITVCEQPLRSEAAAYGNNDLTLTISRSSRLTRTYQQQQHPQTCSQLQQWAPLVQQQEQQQHQQQSLWCFTRTVLQVVQCCTSMWMPCLHRCDCTDMVPGDVTCNPFACVLWGGGGGHIKGCGMTDRQASSMFRC